MSRSHVVGILWLGLAACQAAAPVGELSQPVLGATLSTDDPGVVALTTEGGSVFCTGTLVSPRVVLTAGHCVDMLAGAGKVFFGNFTGGAGISVPIDQSAAHPDWTGSLANGNDIGVVLIATPRDPALAVPMSSNDLSTMIGGAYRVVGFGIHDRDTGELDGNKRTAMMEIESINGDYVEVTDPDPATLPETAICQGDSGGPGFIPGVNGEEVAGVHSYSITGCFNPSGDTRVALFAESFVRPWINANDPTCGEDGLCARIGCSADPDCQPCGPDGTCATSCPLPDVDCATQGLGEVCRADSQCMSGLCVHWDEDPRVKFCSQPCASGCPDNMPCDDVQPYGSVCYYVDEDPPGALGAACTEPSECAESLCEDNVCTYTCSIPQGRLCQVGFLCQDHGMGARCYADPALEEEGGGGCAVGTGPAGLWVGLGLLVVIRRRRRHRA
jgi:hypothetical protein